MLAVPDVVIYGTLILLAVPDVVIYGTLISGWGNGKFSKRAWRFSMSLEDCVQ